ncbi:MAG: hypothetical protein KTR25_10800 [Myxococcales bacterium]|nr:hypothetical protein [Myxococcales bacterium]
MGSCAESAFYIIEGAIADLRLRPSYLFFPVAAGRGIEVSGWLWLAQTRGLFGAWVGIMMILVALLSHAYLATPPAGAWSRSWPWDWLTSMGLSGVRGFLVGFVLAFPPIILLAVYARLATDSERAVLFLIGLPVGLAALVAAFFVTVRSVLMPVLGEKNRWFRTIGVSWRLTASARMTQYLVALVIVWGLELMAALLVAALLGGDSPAELGERSWGELTDLELYGIAAWRLVDLPVELLAGRVRWYGLNTADCRCKTA